MSSEGLGSQRTLLSRLRVSDKSVNEDLDLVLLFYWPLQQLHQYSRVLLKLAACFDVVRRKPKLFLLPLPVLFHYHLTNPHVPPFSFLPLSLQIRPKHLVCPLLYETPGTVVPKHKCKLFRMTSPAKDDSRKKNTYTHTHRHTPYKFGLAWLSCDNENLSVYCSKRKLPFICLCIPFSGENNFVAW